MNINTCPFPGIVGLQTVSIPIIGLYISATIDTNNYTPVEGTSNNIVDKYLTLYFAVKLRNNYLEKINWKKIKFHHALLFLDNVQKQAKAIIASEKITEEMQCPLFF